MPRHACRNFWGRGPVACVSGLHAPRDGTGSCCRCSTVLFAFLDPFGPFGLIHSQRRGENWAGVDSFDLSFTRNHESRGGLVLIRCGLIWPHLFLSRRWRTAPSPCSSPGVVKLLISAHFRSFPIIPLVDGGDGVGDARFLPSWERGGVNPGLIWPCLALFTPSGEAGNEATVILFRLWWLHYEWPGAANF